MSQIKTPAVDIPIILGSSNKPLFIELYECLRQAILDGRIEDGAVLPSTRDLASKLGISRHTVLKAIKLLVTQGYVDSTEQCLRVYKQKQEPSLLPASSNQIEPLKLESLSSFAQNIISANDFPFPELNFAPPKQESEPQEQWHRIINTQMKTHTDSENADLDPLGEAPLRQAISNYLNRFRSLRCNAANVVVFAGPTAALDFLGRISLNTGDTIIVENPGFKHARRIFSAHGAQIETIDVDSDGLIVRQLNRLTDPAKFIYLTPAHQDPTGATMSLQRRQDLLRWAKKSGTLIVEDGYDSEYWHKGRPLPAIQGLDDHDCVVYLASFWRFLFPATRISFAVFPNKWMGAVKKFKALLERDVSLIEQKALTEFLEKGLVERYLRKNQHQLTKRRQLLIISLMKELGARISIARESSGTHLIVKMNVAVTEEEIQEAAYQAKLPLISTADHYASNAIEKQFMVPFSKMDDQQIVSASIAFAAQLTSPSPRTFVDMSPPIGQPQLLWQNIHAR